MSGEHVRFTKSWLEDVWNVWVWLDDGIRAATCIGDVSKIRTGGWQLKGPPPRTTYPTRQAAATALLLRYRAGEQVATTQPTEEVEA